MTWTIRPASAADAEVVIEFNRLLAEETEGKVLDSSRLRQGVLAALADPHKARYFLAEHAGQAVGQLMLTWEWSDWRNGWFWWLQSIYVRRAYRRQGVLRALLQHVEQLARNQGDVVGLRLYVADHNHLAQQAYLALGLEPAGYRVLEKLFLS